MGRIFSLDYGRARIGIAISDERRCIATPLIALQHDKTFPNKLQELLTKWKPVDEILLGLPLLMSGKDSPMTAEVRAFAEKLKTYLTIPIVLWDERLSSAQSDRLLREAELNRKQRSEKIDALSAAVVLQSYLEAKTP
ncbi:MAG: Holliday junction resolvase RuvX [Verrucomicrobia bacterium]|nr:Holliday junction resolvase RuvX [Verrucomicrobiota bacterium]